MSEFMARQGDVLIERADGKADITWKQPSVGLLVVAIKPAITGGLTTIKISAETLAASLILFCINHKIPMPVDSTKRLQKSMCRRAHPGSREPPRRRRQGVLLWGGRRP